ncbi:DNA-dependent helicase II [Halolamina pelagica]|uniref:DNA-dependent helicase II n=1 Tax=Halolamina pelagica TaxID=699431 RepID=A0A0P7I1D0_9EURY|nr:DNA-dependent helicase II [Halolamina pelagica]
MTESDVHVTRLFGGPGSGKTTALLDRVEELLEDPDVTVRDVLVVSYTRAAAAEIRERLAERLDTTPRALQGNVSTMHAKAYELLDLSRGDVVGESDKEEFCEEYGVEYEDEKSGAGRRTARSTTLGNKVIATSQWLQRTDREVADWYDVPFQWDVEDVRLPPEIDPNAQEGNKYTPTWPSDDDRLDVPEAIRAWRNYKGENGVVGFADMLERVAQRSLQPNVDYLIIDEFQDITTLQSKVYEEWKPHLEKALIAGDDDQVVYAWQGADPDLLLDEDVDEDVVLPNSYRLPSRVLNVVNKEIRHIDKRQEKDLRPRKEGGRVEAAESPSMLELVRNVRHTVEQEDRSEDGDGTVMLLFRARYQMFDFVDEFIDEGMPFSSLTDQRLWTDRLTDYVRAIEAVDAGERLTALQARRLADILQESAFGSSERDDLYDLIDEIEEQSAKDDLAEIPVAPDAVEDVVPFMPGPRSGGHGPQDHLLPAEVDEGVLRGRLPRDGARPRPRRDDPLREGSRGRPRVRRDGSDREGGRADGRTGRAGGDRHAGRRGVLQNHRPRAGADRQRAARVLRRDVPRPGTARPHGEPRHRRADAADQRSAVQRTQRGSAGSAHRRGAGVAGGARTRAVTRPLAPGAPEVAADHPDAPRPTSSRSPRPSSTRAPPASSPSATDSPTIYATSRGSAARIATTPSSSLPIVPR